MVVKLFKFMLAFIAMMTGSAGLVVLAIFLFRVDPGAFIAAHPLSVRAGFTLYGAAIAFLYFWLQERFITFKPPAKTHQISKSELLQRLAQAFDASVEGKRVFDFKAEKNRVAITWSASIHFVQPSSVGGLGKKRVVVLTLAEGTHDVYFLMKEKDWGWDLSQNFFNVSLSYAAGIFAEVDAEYRPSINYSKEEGLTIDVKKLLYNSNDLWMPIQKAVLDAGWTLRGGMAPGLLTKILFTLPVALIFYLMALFITWIAHQGPATANF